MPGCARKDIVDPGEVGLYHCYSRCVRRARLCGVDEVSGQNYDHRKVWIEERLELLAAIFAMEVCDNAVLDNHMHQVIRTRPDLAERWSDEEVVRRWWRLHPRRRQRDGTPAELTDDDLAGMLSDSEKVAQWRSRLASLSWFMKELKEPIARRANREDDVTGHFFEARFSSPRLLDPGAVLLCSIYVDLNPIRAGVAKTPEQARHTSAYRRILARQQRRRRRARTGGELRGQIQDPQLATAAAAVGRDPDAWLCPINELGEADNRTAPWCRASDKGFLPLELDDYLQLLDWTGRQLREDKRGAIPPHLEPILVRLELQSASWLDAVEHYQDWFHRAVGCSVKMAQAAARAGRRWLHGLARCRRIFREGG